jgi:hypothetical protein
MRLHAWALNTHAAAVAASSSETAERVHLAHAERPQLSCFILHALLVVFVQVVKAYQYTSLTSVTLLVRGDSNAPRPQPAAAPALVIFSQMQLHLPSTA